MPDIADIADLAQRTLSDSAGTVWIQADVEYWVLEAIRDYSTHFHRTCEETINASDGVHEYSLTRDFIDMVLVEYPSGEDPPIFLQRMPRTDPRFWLSDRYYDLELSREEDTESLIWISAEGETGEQIAYTYLAAYYDGAATPIPDVEVLVPDRHIPILVQYVEWKATSERLFDELMDPDRTIHLIDGMVKAVEAKRQAYDQAIAAALAEAVRSGWTSRWRMDAHDRIY
jgi:hypothetical protein